MDILTPSCKEVARYLNRWNSLENYVLQESSLKKLFTKTYPLNIELDDILIKVCSLNDFYSTHIFSPFTVAKHILDLKIDQRLHNLDFSLVNNIALVQVKNNKCINFYSFATKYCSHHLPEDYPIFDSFVEKLLIHFQKTDEFFTFKRNDLRMYPVYREILIQFRNYYGLESYTLKQVDKYLWQAGKDYFPIKY